MGHMRNENKDYGDETQELLSVRHILPTMHLCLVRPKDTLGSNM